MGEAVDIDVVIAGSERTVSFADLQGYARGSGTSRTLDKCDLRKVCDPSKLSIEDVAATRSMKSRISGVEAEWFVERAATAPWANVPGSLKLGSANLGKQRLGDARALFGHFIDHAPKGVAMGKIHKVLHLVRPQFFPILDSRLQRTYRHAATGFEWEYLSMRLWSAVRSDLLHSTTGRGIAGIRTWAASRDDAEVRRLALLTDLRLLDICTWATFK